MNTYKQLSSIIQISCSDLLDKYVRYKFNNQNDDFNLDALYVTYGAYATYDLDDANSITVECGIYSIADMQLIPHAINSQESYNSKASITYNTDDDILYTFKPCFVQYNDRFYTKLNSISNKKIVSINVSIKNPDTNEYDTKVFTNDTIYIPCVYGNMVITAETEEPAIVNIDVIGAVSDDLTSFNIDTTNLQSNNEYELYYEDENGNKLPYTGKITTFTL